jgi:hypothetical protein
MHADTNSFGFEVQFGFDEEQMIALLDRDPNLSNTLLQQGPDLYRAAMSNGYIKFLDWFIDHGGVPIDVGTWYAGTSSNIRSLNWLEARGLLDLEELVTIAGATYSSQWGFTPDPPDRKDREDLLQWLSQRNRTPLRAPW